MNFIRALNEIHDNIWAIIVMAMGAVVAHYDKVSGAALIALGVNAFQRRIKPGNSEGAPK